MSLLSSEILSYLRSHALITPLTVRVSGVATHPEDDLVLSTALSGNVEYLVTGDIKLQRLGTYQGIQMLSPRAFLRLLEHENG